MREVIFKSWCDRCESLGEPRQEARNTFTVGIVAGEARPALRVIELCDECAAAEIDVLGKLLGTHSIPVDLTKVKAPAAPAVSPPETERVECRVCGATLAKSAILGHVWAVHRPGQTRPVPPTVCPECRGVYEGGMWMHRTKMHGKSALDEAYKGLV